MARRAVWIPSLIGSLAAMVLSGTVAAKACGEFADLSMHQVELSELVVACDADDSKDALQLARAALFVNDFERAQAFLATAEQDGGPEVLYLLGQIAENGWGGRADPVDAFFNYRSAADAGYVPGKIAFVDAILSGDRSRLKPQAIETLQTAVAQGELAAAAPLARALFRGNGIKRNWIEANQLASKGELAGDPESLYLIGTWHRDGTAAQKDVASALDYFSDAAALGYVPALFEQGLLRLNSAAPQRWANFDLAIEDMLNGYLFTASPQQREALYNRLRRLPSKDARMGIQRELNAAGLDTGGIDGSLGAKSKAALEAYRSARYSWPQQD